MLSLRYKFIHFFIQRERERERESEREECCGDVTYFVRLSPYQNSGNIGGVFALPCFFFQIFFLKILVRIASYLFTLIIIRLCSFNY